MDDIHQTFQTGEVYSPSYTLLHIVLGVKVQVKFLLGLHYAFGCFKEYFIFI